MTLVTSHGQRISDADIAYYFSRHPSDAQVANDAAGFGLTADQLAYALSLGRGASISASMVRGWVATPGSGYTWAADGTLAHSTTTELTQRLSGTLDLTGLAGPQTLKLDAGYAAAQVKGLLTGGTIESDAAATGNMTVTLADATHGNDQLTLKLAAPGSADFKTIDAPGVETLDLVSTTTSATPASVTNTLTLSTTAHTTLNITGNAALDLSPGWQIALMSVKTVAAATFDAGLHVYLYGNTNDLAIGVGGGNDIIVAGFGNDTIAAGAGDDIIFAGRASDVVDAGPGNDWIRGGPAKDVMTGGAGVDTYAYVYAYESSDSTGVDIVTDFTGGPGGDLLDFTALTHGAATFMGNVSGAAAVDAALHAGAIRAVFDTSTSLLHVDLDANGMLDATNDIAIQLTGVSSSLTAANFIF
ncbi:calcium-binding protein [Caenimonas aquaedulcis]|uniref:Calcium-binding protein n=1 Tax=Caenimonas aquaedulcis TaxID=2793270 RepID=A0A931H1K8_9BURK|nr:hypothetical protein [Caenimonas aquaedulcis]MBG9386872.1 hypothetical protein [Caenimonas aquaedulcis]